MATWHRNHFHVYRYNGGYNHKLVRSLKLPPDQLINYAKFNKSTNMLAIIVNYAYVIFLEWTKFSIEGIYINNM